jgi:Ni/Fe-hydrogenase subunit HybB-like protein
MTVKTSKSTFPVGTLVLGLFALFGLYSIMMRYSLGLGGATNLTDTRPWGLWIAFDVLCGVALAAGGFTMAAVFYIFRLKRFAPLTRPTILTAYLGYIVVGLSVMLDIGRSERIYHPLFFWNPHSVMFEVAWCVMTYLFVLTIENTTIIFEGLKMEGPLKLVKSLTIPIVIAGIVLSTMHQSSLGGLFLLMPDSLHPLWYTPLLPVLFYVSAIAVGMAMIIFESTVSAKAFGRKVESHLLAEIGGWLRYVLGFYLLLKLADVIIGGDGGALFGAGIFSTLFWAEILIGVVIPIVLLSVPIIGRHNLFVTAVLVILGLVLNRFNVGLLGHGVFYAPSWTEFGVTFGLTSAAILIYMFTVKSFPVLDQDAH